MNSELVTGADGHMWTVRRQFNWRQPATIDNFELDVRTSNVPAFAFLTLIVTSAVVLVATTPDSVLAPKIEVAVLLLTLFFPIRWTMRRPWTLVAESGDDAPIERWVATIRGPIQARRQFCQVIHDIEEGSQPSMESPFEPVN
jgi:hypothetical protein